MSDDPIGVPREGEYDPYYQGYVERVPAGELATMLERGLAESLGLMRSFSEEQGVHSYAPGKWTLKEVFGHIIDTERILAYRALAIARGESQSIPGFDQDAYVDQGSFVARSWANLADEYEHVRRANLALFATFDGTTWRRSGTANDVPVTVRSLAHIIAGHEAHHLAIVRERYLV